MQLLAEPAGPAQRRRQPVLLHERAAHELRALCQGILHDTDAARRIARFDTARDPGGALAVDRIDGFGTIPQPNADLAHQLEDLVTTDQ